MREHSDHFISCPDCELERCGVALGCCLKFGPRADIADVALDHFVRPDKVNITDKLDLDFFAGLRAKRQILVPDVLVCLQRFESSLIRCNVFEQTDLPELEAGHAFERIIEKTKQKCIHIDDLAVIRVKNQDPTLRSFEYPPVAKLRYFEGELQRVSSPAG